MHVLTLITVETAKCWICGKGGEVQVPLEGYNKWRNGALIQQALPDLSAPEREMLITGIHPSCWLTLGDGDD